MKKYLIQGLMETGIHVLDIGCVTTPMFYFALDAEFFMRQRPREDHGHSVP
ncbi:MAG: hypothetical protein ACLRMZ_09830 [Blautia marasmi]